jgi:hypothetical protein
VKINRLAALPGLCVNARGQLQLRSCLRGLKAGARARTTFMAELKFSCPHCGQHISCNEEWSGHQIPCPACKNGLVVPHIQAAPVAAALAPPPVVSQPPTSDRPRLAAGVTQVARSTAAAPAPLRRAVPGPPKTGNPVLKFAMIAVVLAVIGGAAYLYVPGLLNHVQDAGTPKTPAPANASSGGGGPLGEVNGAMDISDTLDGSAPSRPSPRPPAAAQRPASAKPAVSPATNSAPKPARPRTH